MLGFSPERAALVFLLLNAPLLFIACWEDLRRMKLPNRLNLAIGLVFLLAGPLVMPLTDWAWRLIHFPIAYAVALLLLAITRIGAGDLKMGIAISPYIAPLHLVPFLQIFAAFLLGAFVAHRLLRRMVRQPDWVSWSRRDFPMGLAIAGAFATYLAELAFPGMLAALFAPVAHLLPQG